MFEEAYREAYGMLKKAIGNMANDIISDRESTRTAIKSLLAQTMEIDDSLTAKIEAVLEDMEPGDGYSNDDQ